MTAVDRLLAEAARWVGTTEDPPGSNRTRFGAWALEQGHRGMQGVAWCDIFVSYCAAAVGLDEAVPFSAYVPGRLAAARRAGIVDRVPARGALVCFQFDADPQADHIGIVESWDRDGTLHTIEGNTSPDDRGSQANGGGVHRRTRRMTQVAGIIHPPYPTEADVPLTPDDIRALWLTEFDVADPVTGKTVRTTGAGLVWLQAWREAAASGGEVPVTAALRLLRASRPPAAPSAEQVAAAVAQVLARQAPTLPGGLPVDAPVLDVHEVARAVVDELHARTAPQ